MPNTIRLKRRLSGDVGSPGQLRNAEVAFNEVDRVLYYGIGYDANTGYSDSILQISGPGAFVTRNTEQEIYNAKVFSANVTVNAHTVVNTLEAYSGLLTSNSATVNLFLTSPNINIAANTGITTINNSLLVKGDYEIYGNTAVGGDFVVTGDLSVNGGNLNTDETVFYLLAQPNTIYFGSSANNVVIASSVGETTVNNNFHVLGDLTTIDSANTSIGGDVHVANSAYIGGDLHVTGNLGVDGTLTTINSTTVTVDDKNLELASTESPSDLTADGGGITLKGTTDKTILWDLTNSNWTSSENWNIASGKVFKINNTSVLSANTLGSGVINSSLKTLGTITSGVWNATTIAAIYGGTGFSSYTTGDILYASNSTTLTKLTIGSEDQFLQVKSGVPTWQTTLDGGEF
jgi:hypothetical protein